MEGRSPFASFGRMFTAIPACSVITALFATPAEVITSALAGTAPARAVATSSARTTARPVAATPATRAARATPRPSTRRPATPFLATKSATASRRTVTPLVVTPARAVATAFPWCRRSPAASRRSAPWCRRSPAASRRSAAEASRLSTAVATRATRTCPRTSIPAPRRAPWSPARARTLSTCLAETPVG